MFIEEPGRPGMECGDCGLGDPEELRVITVNQIAHGSVGHNDNEFSIPNLRRTMFTHLQLLFRTLEQNLGNHCKWGS